MSDETTTHPAELVVYFGSALVLAFGALAVALSWDEMSAPVQVLVLGAAAAVLAVASYLTPGRTVAAGRIGDVTGTAAAVVLGWAAGLGGHHLGLSDELAVSVGAFVGAGGSVVAYLRRNGVVPMAVAGSGTLTAVIAALADLAVPREALLLAGSALGLGWWALGASGTVRPPRAVMLAGGIHLFVLGVAFLDLASAWAPVATAVTVAAYAWALLSGIDPKANRSLAVMQGLLGIAQLGALIDDVVLRFVVGGIAVGLGIVVAGVSMIRRNDSLGSTAEEADNPGS